MGVEGAEVVGRDGGGSCGGGLEEVMVKLSIMIFCLAVVAALGARAPPKRIGP